jgi:hypothetical protein
MEATSASHSAATVRAPARFSLARGLALQLQEVVSQGFHPVRQPPVAGPQGLDEGVEGVALLLEPAELGAHLVKGAVPVSGADL